MAGNMSVAGGQPIIRYDLAQFGNVTDVTTPLIFKISSISPIDTQYIGYYVYVFLNAGGVGGPPQGETRLITAVDPITGYVTIDSPYTSPIAIGDSVLLLNPAVGGVISLPTAAGIPQTHPAIIDLNQPAGNYTLYTGTAFPFILTAIIVRPRIAAGGALTNITVQTNDVTVQQLITLAQGAVANLTQENQIAWNGLCYIAVGRLIQLTIVGGATGVATLCDIAAVGYAVEPGGTLTP